MQERIMNGLWSKIGNRKKNNKGFTLVELIVVIVILAILAALLIPALLGWIDKAKEEQYALEARNIYLAAQAQASEAYAAGAAAPNDITTTGEAGKFDATEIKGLSDVQEITAITATYGTTNDKEKHTIKGLTVEFTSSTGTSLTGVMTGDKSWSFTVAP